MVEHLPGHLVLAGSPRLSHTLILRGLWQGNVNRYSYELFFSQGYRLQWQFYMPLEILLRWS